MSLARRSFLQTLLGSSFVLGGQRLLAAAEPEASPETTKPFTVAFLTDTHQPAGNQDVMQKVGSLIDGIQAREAAPELFVFGGDNVMAVDGRQSDEQADIQFQQWQENVNDRLKVPSLSCIGNHDIRWKDHDKENPETYREKDRATKTYGMPARYYSAEHGGWQFFLLDTFQYQGCEIDEAQWKWLEDELAKSDLPAVVVTHAPLMSVTHFYEASTDKGIGNGYAIPSGWSPQRLNDLRLLFRKHPRVQLCLSGHMHTVDRVDVDDTTYICGGAVSGNWWTEGGYLGYPNSWIELKLFPDGSWSHQRHETS
ncbi:metallophosphoesterase family protein [Bremerella cremea]|uniref:metallophosphoesterase family protein n=1 Tax=Bremerella cremea TaxID=1031537 RepID=UPI0031E8D50F